MNAVVWAPCTSDISTLTSLHRYFNLSASVRYKHSRTDHIDVHVLSATHVFFVSRLHIIYLQYTQPNPPAQMTAFVAVVTMDANRQKAGKIDCCCCFTSKTYLAERVRLSDPPWAPVAPQLPLETGLIALVGK